MPPTARTRVAAVVGDPVRHSLSPAILNAAFGSAGVDWVFVAFEVPRGSGAAAVEAMRTLGLGGMSVTMPHKDEVAAAVDRCTERAAALGSVNCLYWDRGQVVGDSTDGEGFVNSLGWSLDLDPAGMSVAVVGAGGAARAIVAALAESGAAEVVVVNRTAERAEAAAALAGPVGRRGGSGDLPGVDLVVNATPLGMDGHRGMPCDPALLHPGQAVVDIVYHPLSTPWLAAAARRGARVANGVDMLVGQAAASFSRWTGVAAPLEAMRSAALGAIASPGASTCR